MCSRAAVTVCRSLARSTRSSEPSPTCWSPPLDLRSRRRRCAAAGRRLPRRRHTPTRSCAGRSRRRKAATTKPPRRPSKKRRRHRARRIRRPRGCTRQRAICGSRPTGQARPRSTSTERWRCPASKPSSVAKLCSTGPALPKRKTTSRPPAPRPMRRGDHRRRPVLLVFLGIPGDPRGRRVEGCGGDRQGADFGPVRSGRSCSRLATSQISTATTIQARSYWMRAAGSDPNGPIGKAAAKAVEMLGVTPAVKTETKPRK